MKKDILKNILTEIAASIKDSVIIWRLDGSVNLFVQGMDVNPRDIDIATDEKGLDVFRKFLKKYIKRDYWNDKIKASTIECLIDGVEIEINSYQNPKLSLFEKIRKINWEGVDLNILPLADAANFYKRISREEKERMISEFVKKIDHEEKFAAKE